MMQKETGLQETTKTHLDGFAAVLLGGFSEARR